MKTQMMNTLSKFRITLKKHSPQILIFGGVVGVVVSGVMACRASTKLNSILENARTNIDTIKNHIDDPTLPEKYTPEDAKKDQITVYTQTGLSIVKLYAPSVILGSMSIASILISNNIMRARTAGLAAAYLTIDKAHKDYRKRVIERYGEKVDHELRNNIRTKKVDEIVVDENGKEKKVKSTITIADESEYARFFDESNPAWDKNSEHTLNFLKCQQNFANDRLRAYGHLFLNEVYDMLAIPRTKAGQVVGWVYNHDNPINTDTIKSDNFVDFGISELHKEVVHDFVEGYEPVILLNFNVEGPVLDLLP